MGSFRGAMFLFLSWASFISFHRLEIDYNFYSVLSTNFLNSTSTIEAVYQTVVEAG